MEELKRDIERTGLGTEVRAWALLAIAALAVAGVFALLLALSRTPHVQELMPWSWQSFFHKGLITHVIFSFIVWFVAVQGLISTVATAKAAPSTGMRLKLLGPVALVATVLSYALLSAPALLDRGPPSLNNYVPVLDDPLYYAGVTILFLGVGLSALRLLLQLIGNKARLDCFAYGTSVAAALYLIALFCLLLTWMQLPIGLEMPTRNEHLFWGPGHLLQFCNVALLITGWQLLSNALPERLFRPLLFSLIPFSLAGIAFLALHDLPSLALKQSYTDLLWYGMALQPLIAGLAVARHLLSQPNRKGTAGWAMMLSLLLFGAGGIMGYFLGPNDTRIPSHYHAVIGGVNLVFMGLYLTWLLPILERAPKRPRLATASVILYGFGQFAWTAGMFLAGLMGVARKTAGAAQGLDSSAKIVSMSIMGAGGVIAVVGGILFVAIVLAALLRKRGPHGA
jgi:cytochrome c oxidase subunit 1